MGAMANATGMSRPNFANQILRRPRGVIFCISSLEFSDLNTNAQDLPRHWRSETLW